MGDPRVLESPWVSILKWSNYNIISDDLGVPSESMGDWLSCCSFAKWGFIGCSCLPVHWSSILPKPVARLEVSIVWREGRDSQSQKSWSHKYTASSRLHPMIQITTLDNLSSTYDPLTHHGGWWFHISIPTRPILLILNDWFLWRKKVPQKSFGSLNHWWFTFYWLDILKGIIFIHPIKSQVHPGRFIPWNPMRSHQMQIEIPRKV